MELAEYIKILKKNAYLVALFTVLGIALALVFVSKINKGPRYEQLFFIMSVSEEERTPAERTGESIASTKEAQDAVYRFEGFYATEKARNFTDTALAIILSPDFKNEVTTQATALSARKIAPQLIRLSIYAANLDSARSTMNKTKDRFNQKIVDLTGDSEFQLKPIGTAIVPVTAQPQPKALIIFGAIAGFVFALVTIGFKTYFKV
ncbi:hypothetical protein A3D81_02285 [Candidatus Curtissbacteria bacterium RIFCSPHIGHO2_02_FULL_40_17]|uniref:Polysaccharide chain length determinant N-terminal domain-containing protein n=3 Tax=Candidatus Curtissiibacteriota TaxID=1752717 RepID=A0A1F5GH91_9BACT|nr:MAG: hypothetical protein A2693_00120 [Candidatus Curtissbacteria bacterium RIFCSPHIGHO2_01_FULL_40_12]OGD91199.1 MAG: hypothetical protein A3D81_02285 [Candidatus Curtissbacteria bacterium RIFCSPHIGHO2_02_FULL_40_17]OGE03214.1 MAG: hypothetical protein A3F45_04235 [Candidatus Curtissbacteria bacterium RIFCSPHIGHO2_12_FULL_41_17]